MESIDFIVSLTGLISAVLLVIVSINGLISSINSATGMISLEMQAQKCAFIADTVYSNQPNEIREKINCSITQGIASSKDSNNSMHSTVLNKKTRTILQEGKTIILVNGNEHYR
ncbi:MAG: hypothetical protein JW703_01140 [Candidatus Diapherotrites archaeon]|nr:hypothetical protein [Candidatus Diapherotrites archaeon]